MKKMPFRFKFIFSFLTIELFFISLIVFFNFTSLSKLTHSLIEEKIQTATILFAEMAKTPLIVYDLGTLDNQAESFVKMKNIVSVQVFDVHGKLLCNATSDPKIHVENFYQSLKNIQLNNRTFRLVEIPIKLDAELLGKAKILFELTDSLQTINDNRNWTYILMFIEISISSFIAYVIGFRLTNSLNTLTFAAENIARNNDIIISDSDPNGDEISKLSHSFFIMQQRISERNNKLHEAVVNLRNDIAKREELEHELRKTTHFLKRTLDEQEALLEVKTTGFAHLKERRFLWCNETLETILGYEIGELQGKSVRIMYADDDEYDSYGREGYQALARNGTFTREIKAVKKDGSALTLMASMTALKNVPSEAMGVIVDITEQKTIESKLSKAFQQNEHLLNIIDRYISFVKVDKDGTILQISSEFCKQLGGVSTNIIGKNINILKSGETSIELYQKIWAAVDQKKSFSYEIKDKNFMGSTSWFHVNISPAYDDFGQINGYFAFYENIDRQVNYKNSAETDALTGLANRVRLDKILSHEELSHKRYKQPFSVILIDIDHFKEVNDQFGHQSGDVILKEFAQILNDNIRETDFIGRWGGEEFLIICPNTDENGAYALAESLRKAVETNNFSIIKHKTASFGVVEYRDDDSLEQVFNKVDHFLYLAKDKGRNVVMSHTIVELQV